MSAHPIGLAAILIMSVSTVKTAVILFIMFIFVCLRYNIKCYLMICVALRKMNIVYLIKNIVLLLFKYCYYWFYFAVKQSWLVGFIVFNATFNNVSVISWRSGLLVEETGGPGENCGPVASHWQTWSHNVISGTSLWINVFYYS
jgi:hypothetical protein